MLPINLAFFLEKDNATLDHHVLLKDGELMIYVTVEKCLRDFNTLPVVGYYTDCMLGVETEVYEVSGLLPILNISKISI